MKKPKLIAFYLPQYHPIPENDKWWGKGFTEWTNVAKAKPLFKGHHQPHIPADLGFYDLRVPEVRQAQADMARNYGIHGFCYYHYWFNGKRLLERPFREVLESGEPDFPFCLCWANEDWTRQWDGRSGEVLISQNYSNKDDINHIRALLPAFADPRYIRHEGKPIFLVYRSNLITNTKITTDIWRKEAERLGIGEIFLLQVQSSIVKKEDPFPLGFDGAVEFQPDWRLINGFYKLGTIHRIFWKIGDITNAFQIPRIFYYDELAEKSINEPLTEYLRYPCVLPRWDNSPRRGKRATIFIRSTPETYKLWLIKKIKESNLINKEDPLVFINAWNEWGEGNYLEPDLLWGHAYLEATKQAVDYCRRD